MIARRDITVIRKQLLPLVNGVSFEDYRTGGFSHICCKVLKDLGYQEIGSGCCASVWVKQPGKYVIKVMTSNSVLAVPLTANPTRKLWEQIQRDGKEDSAEVYCLPECKMPWKAMLNKEGFIPKFVKHFLFYEYIEPRGLFAVQRKVNVTYEEQARAEILIGSGFKQHTDNYGMDGDRPVVIDYY